MTRRWRVRLSVVLLCLTASLFTVRSVRMWNEAESRVSGGFYDDCCRDLRMVETKLINCLNLPAVILVAPIRVLLWKPIYISRGIALFYSDIVLFVAVFAFWWWVGKQLDDRRRAMGLTRSGLWCYASLALLSCALTAVGAATLLTGFTRWGSSLNWGPEYAISAIVWGLLLAAYSFFRLRRGTGSHILARDHS